MIGLEEDKVVAWLAARVGDVGAAHFTLVEGGHSCLTYIVRTDAGTFVVRRPPVGQLLASAHDVVREHRVISALADSGVPVAPIVGLETDTEVIGAPFYVMRFVDGVVLHDRSAAEKLSVDARRHAGESMIDVLVALQEVDPDTVGLEDFGKKADYLGRQLKRWQGQWLAADTRPFPRMNELHDWLQANKPDEGPARIVHGDFRLGNAIHNEDGSVAALLDWELSTLGPVAADLAYFMRSWLDPHTSGAGESASSAEGMVDRDVLVARYGEKSGRPVDDLSYWMAFHAWRSAAIVAGVFTRYKHGQMGDHGDISHFEDAVGFGCQAGLIAAGIA